MPLYLDYAATTPVRPEAAAAVMEVLTDVPQRPRTKR